MKKEELRKLRRIYATPKMMQMAAENQKQMRYESVWHGSALEKKTVFDIMVRCQTRGKYLMVCVFLPEKLEKGIREPAYEIYCNPEGSEYITRIMYEGKEHKWSGAMIENIGRLQSAIENKRWYKGAEKRIWQNPEGMETIRNYLKTEEKGIWGLLEWQKKVRKENIREKEERQQRPWDEEMKLVPAILPSFRTWMAKEGPNEHFIFYEYNKSGVKEGYCSHCRKMVPVQRAKHNMEGICSRCGIKATYKSSGKIKTLGTQDYKGQCLQKIRGGVVARTFSGNQWYKECDYRNPYIHLREEERILIMDDGTVKRYYYGLYKNKKLRFIQDKNYRTTSGTYYEKLSVKIYKKNLKALKKTVLRNSAIDLWDDLPIGIARYLAVEKENPAIEKLARVGMFRLAGRLMKMGYDRLLLDQEATELAKILRIDNARLKRLKLMDGDEFHLRWLQQEKRADTIWPDEMIKDFGNSKFNPGSAFGFLRVPNRYVKIWNYLKKQSAICGKTLAEVKGTWQDYINMAGQAKMDTENEMIWKPRDLASAHHEMVMFLQCGEIEKETEKLREKWPEVEKVLPGIQKFEYTGRKFSIVAPKGIIDIVREGRALQHCVHTCDFYFDRIQRNETYLFFLRRNEHKDIPWYTLEVEPNGNIRQKRTTGDNQNKDFDEAVKFLRKWQKVFVSRMSDEERKLGELADHARMQEYAQLREDGNRVWHGKLAGQLLADVLEQDFMAAMV